MCIFNANGGFPNTRRLGEIKGTQPQRLYMLASETCAPSL
jgi:hypothetical protein